MLVNLQLCVTLVQLVVLVLKMFWDATFWERGERRVEVDVLLIFWLRRNRDGFVEF